MLASKLVFTLFLTLTATLGGAGLAIAAEPDAVRQKELVRLVRQDCGSCHELRDKPVEGLVATIYYGRPGTPMPPWQQFMTEAEAEWIVQKLMSGFPN